MRRLPVSLDFAPANDDAGAEPTQSADFDRPRVRPAQREPGAAQAEPIDEGAPRVELPLALIAALDDAA